MKIKEKDWMDWLHEVRRKSQKQRKSSRRSLAENLKLIEGQASMTRKEPSGVTRRLRTSAGGK